MNNKYGMEISQALRKVEGSATATIFAEAKKLEAKGIDVVHLEIGQPDFKPPDVVLQATADSVLAGNTSYTVSRGMLELRKEVINYHKNVNQSSLNPVENTVITTGAKIGIFGTLWSVLNPGDNVIILNPCWVSYEGMVMSLGAEPRFLAVDGKFEFDEQSLRALLDHKTKALLVNSPSNPTGAMISKKSLQLLYEICAAHDILIISDEIYSEYTYDSNQHHSLLEIKDWMDYGVVINGLSKTFSMTGFRLGYVLGRKTIIDEMNKVNQLTSSCPVNFAQHAGIVALQNIDLMREIIAGIMPNRRKLVLEIVDTLSLEMHPPAGAFYAWLKLPINDDIKWTEELLMQKGVALTPGAAFGPAGKGYVRLSYANSEDNIIKGFNRIKEFLN